MSELLDFTGRKNFDDLKFGKSYNLTQDDITAFKEDCMRINTIHNQMALEQCKIGLLLGELKAGKTWQNVINQKTGFAYMVYSFEDFCKDAFGFSGTKTYALMQIAKFVTSNSENEVHFIDEKYSAFSSSQLTELASVPTYKRHYFTADMTVEQMRVIKKYIEADGFLEDRQKEDFDLLTYAKNYVESKKKPKALPASKPDVLDGQMSLFPEDNDNGESEIFPTSGKTELGEEIIADEIEREYIPERDEYDELDEVQEDMRGDMETIEADAEKSVSEKYRFGTRAHVRDFISDYQTWPGRCGHFFLSPCWCYSLKNGAVIYAMAYDSFIDFSENFTTKRVFYFLQEKGSKNAIELSKEQFERWCSEHKQEL